MECPNIDKTIIEDKFIKKINYKDFGGSDYVFYDHTDFITKYLIPYEEITRVQFCKKIGRKKDIFECFNENEWKSCPHYKAMACPHNGPTMTHSNGDTECLSCHDIIGKMRG